MKFSKIFEKKMEGAWKSNRQDEPGVAVWPDFAVATVYGV